MLILNFQHAAFVKEHTHRERRKKERKRGRIEVENNNKRKTRGKVGKKQENEYDEGNFWEKGSKLQAT